MSSLNPEMRQWLIDNRKDYEFYMLHAILHDPLMRAQLMGTPLTMDDFQDEHMALIIGAMANATKIMRIVGKEVPAPPSPEFMRTYIESAARVEASDDEVIDEAMGLLKELQNPSYREQHYCVMPYFAAWYSSGRAKRAARKLQMESIPDVAEAVTLIQNAMASAYQAACMDADDEMLQVMDGETEERVRRRSTGIAGLDECMNGGWGDAECSLLFSGTGGGKTITAGQCAWWEADHNQGYPLIVSTEVKAREYVARIVSGACSVKINVIQDCANFSQIRQAVAADPGSSFRIKKVNEVLDRIRERLRIAKINTDDGLEARAMLEREVLKFLNKVGHMPTWVCLDWLGSMADIGGGNRQSTSERALAWEYAANGCVKFAETTGIPTLVLAQAVNDAQLKRILTLSDIGISKGIAKNMVNAIGVTNSIDQAGIKAAVTGKAEMPSSMFLKEQFFCVCKSRKGEGRNIPVQRNFLYQRFESGRDRDK